VLRGDDVTDPAAAAAQGHVANPAATAAQGHVANPAAAAAQSRNMVRTDCSSRGVRSGAYLRSASGEASKLQQSEGEDI